MNEEPPMVFTDAWRTTAQAPGFLKSKREALWELRGRPDHNFPAPARYGEKLDLRSPLSVRHLSDRRERGARRRTSVKPEARSPAANPKVHSTCLASAPISFSTVMVPVRVDAHASGPIGDRDFSIRPLLPACLRTLVAAICADVPLGDERGNHA
ncbi:MAG: hypothetical protein FD124_2499 [Alphaproteobacteria bacterium]|nr:MAG: hypothetical protein FD124_2499 [Alphaproteobacteria bacterium]